MIESRAITKWRAMTPEERLRYRRALIPRKVARSMAFEGEPVPPEWQKAQQQRLKAQPDT